LVIEDGAREGGTSGVRYFIIILKCEKIPRIQKRVCFADTLGPAVFCFHFEAHRIKLNEGSFLPVGHEAVRNLNEG
jgi:hypothetical protein